MSEPLLLHAPVMTHLLKSLVKILLYTYFGLYGFNVRLVGFLEASRTFFAYELRRLWRDASVLWVLSVVLACSGVFLFNVE